MFPERRKGTAMAIQDAIRRKLTYEDYALFPEDGQRHEILDGEHYVTPAPFTRHQVVSLELATALHLFVKERGLGQILTAPVDVLLSRQDVAQPDLIFISNERAAIVTEKNIQGAPDLVIEILSDSTRRRDEGIKRERYERLGVREYWLVDPARATVQILRLDGEHLRPVAHLTAAAGDVLTSPLLPGLEIQLPKIFPS
jgi:Uma2 family endonuclease